MSFKAAVSLLGRGTVMSQTGYFFRKTCVNCSFSVILLLNLNLDHVRLYDLENLCVFELIVAMCCDTSVLVTDVHF